MAAKTFNRVIDTLPGSLPIATLPDNLDVDAVAASFIPRLGSLGAADFTKDALWRDIYALTGTTRTFFSSSTIESAWKDVSATHQPTDFALMPKTTRAVRMRPESSWIEARFTFRTRGRPALSCGGFVSLVPDGRGGWKIWLMRTILEQLDGLPDVDTLQPQMPPGQPAGNDHNHASLGSDQFECVVVGAGSAGLCIAGRLQALGVSYVLIDRNTSIGDSWMLRYDTVKLHTVRNWATLPFEKIFTPDYPNLLSKYDIAKAYKQWVDKYGIKIWHSTSLDSGSWDQQQNSWNLRISQEGREKSLRARHLVLAVGIGGQTPTMPSFPGQDKFKGSILHTGNYKSGSPWKGKSGVVVGTGCSGHDVAEDMLDCELSSVTMLQRGSTYVIPAENYHKFSVVLYNDDTPVEKADRMQLSNPLAIGRQSLQPQLDALAQSQAERFDALEGAGFKTERYGDILYHLNERLGGFYLDVGASAKIAQGQIKVKSDAVPTAFNESGLVFNDGSKLQADVVVFATGFVGEIRGVVAGLLGQSVADQVNEFWGLDEEGELRGAFKPTGHHALWYVGGPLGHSRFFSRFVAMQITADLLGTPLPVYKRQPASTKPSHL